jgi:hypothetical protein
VSILKHAWDLGQEIEGRMRGKIKAVVILAFVGFAQTGVTEEGPRVFYAYMQWERLEPTVRAAYIAGAMDSLSVFATGDSAIKTALHYNKCLKKSEMTSMQLAEHVLGYVRARPKFQNDPVQRGLVNYLIELCGAPPA